MPGDLGEAVSDGSPYPKGDGCRSRFLEVINNMIEALIGQ